MLRGDRGEETHSLVEGWTHGPLALREAGRRGCRSREEPLEGWRTAPPPQHTTVRSQPGLYRSRPRLRTFSHCLAQALGTQDSAVSRGQLTKEEGQASRCRSRATWVSCSLEPPFPLLPKRDNKEPSWHCREIQMSSWMKVAGPHWHQVIGDFFFFFPTGISGIKPGGQGRGRAREMSSDPAYFQPGDHNPAA